MQDLRLRPRLAQAAHSIQLAWRHLVASIGKEQLEAGTDPDNSRLT